MKKRYHLPIFIFQALSHISYSFFFDLYFKIWYSTQIMSESRPYKTPNLFIG
jgi:hypothetical protein